MQTNHRGSACSAVIAFVSAALRDWLTPRSTVPVIPPRSNRKLQYHDDKKLYRERNIIERTFNRFKDFRRIATRFDRKLKT